MMKPDEESLLCTPSFSPAPLRPELAERFLAAMQAASCDEGEAELEQRLRRLRPADIGAVRSRVWTSSMKKAATTSRYRRSGRYVLHRWGAAAALFLLCTSGGLFVMNGRASASVSSGLACRSVMETRAGNSVQWQEGQKALRACEVLYEDSFVLDGDEDSTITVRVPVRAQVLIEEEVI